MLGDTYLFTFLPTYCFCQLWARKENEWVGMYIASLNFLPVPEVPSLGDPTSLSACSALSHWRHSQCDYLPNPATLLNTYMWLGKGLCVVMPWHQGGSSRTFWQVKDDEYDIYKRANSSVLFGSPLPGFMELPYVRTPLIPPHMKR